MSQATGTVQPGGMTAEEFWDRQDEFEGCELIDGEVVEMSPTKAPHGRSEVRIGAELDRYFDSNAVSPADVVGGEVGYQVGTKIVRASDVSVHLKGIGEADAKGWHRTPPDLVVEVVSPNDTWPEVERKLLDWSRFGVGEIWVADPRHERLTIRRSDEPALVFEGDELVTSPLLPGFSVPAWRLFKRRR